MVDSMEILEAMKTYVGTAGTISVDSFGAKGDGITDDSGAINTAIAEGKILGYTQNRPGRIRVVFTPGRSYVITTPINLCNMQGVVLDGGAPGWGAVLVGRTGGTKAMIEIIGSMDIAINNMQIHGDSIATPAAGIFVSRSTAPHGNNSSCMDYEGIQFSGYFTRTPVYIVESESNYFRKCNWYTYGEANTPNVYLSRSNGLGLIPTHTTLLGCGYGLWNINFNLCQIPCNTGGPSLHLKDTAGSVYIRDSYLYGTGGENVLIEGGAYFCAWNTGCEGTPQSSIRLKYDPGAASNLSVLRLDSFNFGAPATHSIYAEDNVELRNSLITESPTTKAVRLWGATNCDLRGLCDYNGAATNIAFPAASAYARECKFRLGRSDTLTFGPGAANMDNIVEDMVVALGSRLQVPAVKFGVGNTIYEVLTGSLVWDVGLVANGASVNGYVNIPNITNDGKWICTASLTSLNEGGWTLSAYPTSGWANVVLTNRTGIAHDPGPGTLYVVAMRIQ